VGGVRGVRRRRGAFHLNGIPAEPTDIPKGFPDAGVPIVGLEPSCTVMLKSEATEGLYRLVLSHIH